MKRILAMLLAVIMLVSTPMELLASEVNSTPINVESTETVEAYDTEDSEEGENVADEADSQESDDVNFEEDTKEEENEDVAVDSADTEDVANTENAAIESVDIEVSTEELDDVEADADDTQIALPTGRMEVEFIEVAYEEISDEIYDETEMSTVSKLSAYYYSWTKYSTNYVYNLLNDTYRDVWDDLDLYAWMYMYDDSWNADYTTIGGQRYYHTEFIKVGKVTSEEAYNFGYLFLYSNPQYYFLNNTILSAYDSKGNRYIAFSIYSDFANGSDRAAATEEFISAVDTVVEKAKAYSTDEGVRVKYVHDYICGMTDYNSRFIYSSITQADEETYYTQSAYSVFCTDYGTVCAGYAEAFQMICNALDIDCISVTSPSHQWNKVRINDSWYNVDLTWADQSWGTCYTYFERSDAYYDLDDYLEGASDHQEEAIWEGCLPLCTLDSNPSQTAAGTLPTITNKTANPSVTAEWSKSGYTYTITCDTPGASIYYLVVDEDDYYYDGYYDPSEAYSKCYKYTGSFTMDGIYEIRAIAVCDTYKDSDVVTYVHVPTENDIVYHLDGGRNALENPATYTSEAGSATLANPTRDGYTFGGWYKDEKFKTKVTKIAAGTTGTVELYAKWTANTYTIKFSANGGSGSMSNLTSRKYDTTYTLTANKFKKTGYNFTGWNTQADGKGTPYADTASVLNLTATKGATVTLYAQWEKVTYTITYNVNEGSFPENAIVVSEYQIDTATFSLASPTRNGYKFAGWYSDAKFKTKVTQVKVGSTGNKTFYAKWTPCTVNFLFDANGGTGKMNAMTGIQVDKKYNLPANKFKRTGYIFAGWGDSPTSGAWIEDKAECYLDSERWDQEFIDEYGDTRTLYAQWELQDYTITYKNGGDDNPNATTYNMETSDITLQDPTREGYDFAGWYSDSKCTKRIYTIATLGKTGNKTVYAKWTPHQYTISFDANCDESEVSGTMKDLTARKYGTEYTLTANAFKRTNYTFVGWALNEEGTGTIYANKAKVTSLSATDGENVVLYAQWKPVEYTITYKNGGTHSNDLSYTVFATQNITLTPATRTGYTFGGWYSDSKCTKPISEIEVVGKKANITVYAKWTANQYTINFDGNGATSGEMTALTARVYDKQYALTANKYKRTGYTFKGWSTSASGDVEYKDKAKVTNLATGAENDDAVTLYAVWQRNTYTITYKGDTAGVTNPASYTVDDATITLNNPSKAGYTFEGWYKDSKYKTKVTEIPKGSTGNITLYAKWTAHKYTIQFNGNGSESGTMAALTARVYDKQYSLTANKYKRTGYTFKGWSTSASGDVEYKDKAKVTNLAASTINDDVVTLYAVWEKNTYTITYNNDSTNTVTNPTTYYVDSNTITLEEPYKVGYTFGGWYSDAKFKTKVTQIPTGSTGNKTLYAKWTTNKYHIAFEGNGATSGSTKAMNSCVYDKTYTLTANAFKRTGYVFAGWNTKADGTGITYTDKEKISNLTTADGETITLYAQWKANWLVK